MEHFTQEDVDKMIQEAAMAAKQKKAGVSSTDSTPPAKSSAQNDDVKTVPKAQAPKSQTAPRQPAEPQADPVAAQAQQETSDPVAEAMEQAQTQQTAEPQADPVAQAMAQAQQETSDPVAEAMEQAQAQQTDEPQADPVAQAMAQAQQETSDPVAEAMEQAQAQQTAEPQADPVAQAMAQAQQETSDPVAEAMEQAQAQQTAEPQADPVAEAMKQAQQETSDPVAEAMEQAQEPAEDSAEEGHVVEKMDADDIASDEIQEDVSGKHEEIDSATDTDEPAAEAGSTGLPTCDDIPQAQETRNDNLFAGLSAGVQTDMNVNVNADQLKPFILQLIEELAQAKLDLAKMQIELEVEKLKNQATKFFEE